MYYYIKKYTFTQEKSLLCITKVLSWLFRVKLGAGVLAYILTVSMTTFKNSLNYIQFMGEHALIWLTEVSKMYTGLDLKQESISYQIAGQL